MKKLLALSLLLVSCTNPPSAKTVSEDICKARAAYKAVQLAANGALDPKPGSALEQLERAEDAFCATLPQ